MTSAIFDKISLDDIMIRTVLNPGDMGYVTYLHGRLYSLEYQYGIGFEQYVASGLNEFYQNYDAEKDGVWIAEFNERMVGFLLLMHRESSAQLRYFLVDPSFRGIGLGKKLMELFMELLQRKGYSSAYLWTTSELHSAASLYTRYGFRLVEEKVSEAFGKRVTEQRYDWIDDGSRT